jgi:hypothetical protein
VHSMADNQIDVTRYFRLFFFMLPIDMKYHLKTYNAYMLNLVWILCDRKSIYYVLSFFIKEKNEIFQFKLSCEIWRPKFYFIWSNLFCQMKESQVIREKNCLKNDHGKCK